MNRTPTPSQPSAPQPMRSKGAKAGDTLLRFAHAKFIAAGAEYMAMLPKKKERPEPKPRAIVRGIGGGSFRPDCNMVLNYAPLTDSDACAVLPCATRKQAQQIVKAAPFLLLSREQKVEAIAKAFFAACRTNEGTKHQPGFLTWKQQAEGVRNIYRRDATAILSAIESIK